MYTCGNPISFLGQRYGGLGLLVLRLKGTVGVNTRNPDGNESLDSFTNLSLRLSTSSVIVLRKSCQCLAVFHYNGSQIKRDDPNCPALKIVNRFQKEMEGLFDTFFSEPSRSHADDGRLAVLARVGTIAYRMPENRPKLDVFALNICKIITSETRMADCPVCMCTLEPLDDTSKVVRLVGCEHELHLECLEQAVAHKTQCPTCRAPFAGQTPTGNQPSGAMTVTKIDESCEGFERGGSLRITYSFPGGTQASFHPSPGAPYAGAHRIAYLPDTPEGHLLLARIQEAFRHGLIFRIGTSLTNNAENQTTWASVPHKTMPSGGVGAHGFPDDLYFFNCNNSLDALHVRPAGSDELLG